MASPFEEMKELPLDEVAARRAECLQPSGYGFMVADAVLRWREVKAVIEAAKETRRYARSTFWVAFFTGVTALATLLVAVFSARGG
jgi:hypothetical protein